MVSKKTAEQRIAEIRKELMKSIDYRTLNALLPHNSVASLVDEIIEAGYISKDLQVKIGKILGKRWV